MKFTIAFLAFSLIAIVASSPVPISDQTKARAAAETTDDHHDDSGGAIAADYYGGGGGSGGRTSTPDNYYGDGRTSTPDNYYGGGGGGGRTSTPDNYYGGGSGRTDAGNGAPSVLRSQTYNDITISYGTAGSSAKEAQKIFAAINKDNLSGVSAQDLRIIQNTSKIAQQAEVNGFNPAIDAASGDEAQALQNGKIANKVLKNTANVLQLNIRMAQGENVDPAELSEERAELQQNIDLDRAASGQFMKGVKYNGRT